MISAIFDNSYLILSVTTSSRQFHRSKAFDYRSRSFHHDPSNNRNIVHQPETVATNFFEQPVHSVFVSLLLHMCPLFPVMEMSIASPLAVIKSRENNMSLSCFSLLLLHIYIYIFFFLRNDCSAQRILN